jgi:adenine-specific DNA-methyltransferase
VCTQKCREFITEAQDKTRVGFITKEYSPYEGNERMFFTVENANKIDGIRRHLEEKKENFSEDEYKFLLASLVLSADAVSNVPAVYGCYLKKFKQKAQKALQFEPIHEHVDGSLPGSMVYNQDVLAQKFESHFDAVYLDPPYNQRQYSKNYFPLNMIVQKSDRPLKGKTGIPEDCFLSPFCKKGAVIGAFEKLFTSLNTRWIFMSYSSEGLAKKDDLVELMQKFGTVRVYERDYKRFKSFEYNDGDATVKEYLFCLQRNNF